MARGACDWFLPPVRTAGGRSNGEGQQAPVSLAHRYERRHRRREQQRRIIRGRRRRSAIEEEACAVRPQRGWSTRGELYDYHRMNGSLGVFFSLYPDG